MEKNNETITICTAPPGLYAVIKDMESTDDEEGVYALTVVTAFKYTYYGQNPLEVFSEPIVYCKRKDENALVSGKSKIEFVGSHETCVQKIKELTAQYYTNRNRRK